jgi:hypothetical protein
MDLKQVKEPLEEVTYCAEEVARVGATGPKGIVAATSLDGPAVSPLAKA